MYLIWHSLPDNRPVYNENRTLLIKKKGLLIWKGYVSIHHPLFSKFVFFLSVRGQISMIPALIQLRMTFSCLSRLILFDIVPLI